MATDVSRALLLPDVRAPSDHLLKTLAVYWDELVLPDYMERAASDDASRSEFNEPSEAFLALEEGGVIARWERTLGLPPVDPESVPVDLRDLIEDSGAVRLLAAIAPLLELVESAPDGPARKEYLRDHLDEMIAASVEMSARMLDYAADHYVRRMHDAFDLSAEHNLAPLARSPISHVGSMVGVPGDVPRVEASLLSAVIEAFAVDPDTPIERIILFREKNAASLGRFRASLVDLSESLRQDANATQLLAQARDVYRNRVVPALGDLESVLAEGRIKFFVKSLLGATAVTLAPLDPMKAVVGGATLVGQSIDYSFSREKIVQEHPYGYLHQVSAALPTAGDTPSTSEVLKTLSKDPVAQIRDLFEAEHQSGQANIFDRLWWARPH